MVVHSAFPAVGGSEIQASRLASALLSRGWNVKFVAIESTGGEINRLESEQFHVSHLRRIRVRGLAGAYLVLQFTWLLYRRRAEYDVIHVHIMKTLAFVASVMGLLLRKKVVLKVSGYDELDRGSLNPERANHPYHKLMNWAFRKADAIIAVSHRTEARLRSFGYQDEQIVYLPNGINLDRFRPSANKDAARQAAGIKASRVSIFVGRLSKEKGIEDLLCAWELVRGQFPDALLLIVGDGVLRTDLEALAREKSTLHDGVVFTGAVNDVERYLALADCYICSSLSEGLSNTVLEAMSAGLPIVSTRVSGAEDVVSNGRNGYLTPITDPRELAKAVCEVLSNIPAAQRMGEESRRIAVETFDMARVVERYEHIYND
jgi:L-malate glycosyltransferase